MISLRAHSSLRCDVMIAGAGPAGASAAVHLARAGLRVIVADQKQFPRDKVCGDFVSPVALHELEGLGVSRSRAFRDTNVIRGAAMFLNGKLLVSRAVPGLARLASYGRVIPRQALDQFIVTAARQYGANVLPRHRVTAYDVRDDHIDVFADTPNGEQCVQAGVLIGADGSTSVVARQLRGRAHPRRHRIIAVRAYYEGVRGPASRADLYFSGESFPGYFWLFPTGASTANVGVGMLAETVPETNDHLRALLAQLVQTDPAVRQRLAGARIVGKVTGWPLNTYDAQLPLGCDRILLVGDAAGFINPLNGEGIQYALLSGRWAAAAVCAGFRAGDLSQQGLASYESLARDGLSGDMALASFIVEWIRNRRLNPLWLSALRVIAARAGYDSAYGATLGGILAGSVPARAAASPHVVVSTMEETAAWLGAAAGAFAASGPAMWLSALRSSARFVRDVSRDTLAKAAYGSWAGSVLGATHELVRSRRSTASTR